MQKKLVFFTSVVKMLFILWIELYLVYFYASMDG